MPMAVGTAGIQFKKYHGLGNDFVLIDNRHQTEPVLTPEVGWCLLFLVLDVFLLERVSV